MRQQQHDVAGRLPFGFRAGDELIDDHLRAVGKIAELRLPQRQHRRISQGVTVVEA